MLVTEQEAQKRWCPMGRQPTMVPTGANANMWTHVAANRQPNGDVPSCLGSLCMAWRWHDEKTYREIDVTTNEVLDEQPRRGFCGLFGKPEYAE